MKIVKKYATEGGAPSAVPTRAEVDEALTWDLTPLFENDEAWEKEFEEAQAWVEKLAAYQGKISESAGKLLELEEVMEKSDRQIERLYVYASMKGDQDTANSTYAGMEARMGAFLSRLSAAVSWYQPEITELPDETLERYFEEEKGLELYRHQYKRIREARPHMLSKSEEKLLARAGEVLGNSSHVFSVLDNADQKFPVIKDEEGNDIEISHGRYGKLIESRDRSVRKDTFEGLYSTYRQYRNTYAATLSGQTKLHNFTAEVRGFESARQAALFYNGIPEKVYDQLIETVRNRAELLHRYVNLRKKLLGLDEMHSYDLYVPVVDDLDMDFSIEEAKELIFGATEVLGEEYRSILEDAFNNRWLDLVENQGKRSGAYSGGCYDSPPYILMTWKGTINNLYTLAHELGHSCHSWFSRKYQKYPYGGYPIFLAEIASTTNENLLTDYLLKTLKDEKALQYVRMNYLDGFKGTVFRQTQFADFEHMIHKADHEGTALTADWLCDAYGKMNEEYYGPGLVKDESIALEWARIPHFYYNYYVYQYATGFSAASAFAKRMLSEGEEAVQDYLGYLKAGSSDYPIETLKKAGLDMSSPQPISDALDRFEEVLSQMENL